MKHRCIKFNGVFWLTIFFFSRLSAQINNDDYTYTEITYKNQFGDITGVYESIYIPPVTKYVDGTLQTLSPGMFEERFHNSHSSNLNPKLSSVVNYHVPKDNYFERIAIEKAMQVTAQSHRAHSDDNVKTFMSGTSNLISETAGEFVQKCHERRSSLDEYGYQMNKFEDEMKSNDSEILAADQTNDLVERLRVRQNIIPKCDNVIASVEQFAKLGQKWNRSKCVKLYRKFTGNDRWNPDRCNERVWKHRNFQQDLERQVSAIRADIAKKLDQIAAEMAGNEFQIAEADKTNDLIERLRVRGDVLRRSADAAMFAGRFAQVANEGHERAEKYRNYYEHVKQQLSSIQADLERVMDEYKNSFIVYEEQRSDFNAMMERMNERSRNGKISDEELSKVYEGAERLKGRLNHLQGLASKLYFHDERKGFEEAERAINKTCSKLQDWQVIEKLGEELNRVEANMAINDGQKENADKTNDELERLRVYLEVSKKSKLAADLLDTVYQKVENWNKNYNGELDANKVGNKRDEYRNYQIQRERDIPAIKNDIYTQLNIFDKNKEYYDLAITAADASNDLNKRLETRQEIIPKLRMAADYSHRFTTIADEDHDRMRRFRNDQHYVEGELPAIEADLAAKVDKGNEGQPPQVGEVGIGSEQKPISPPESEEKGEGGKGDGESQVKEEPVKTEEEQEQIRQLEAEQARIQVAQELRNLETMFNGEVAPDMDAFDNIISALAGGEAFRENEQTPTEFDPSMAGNYIIASYQYRDERFGVSMDIGHMTKFWDGELDYTDQSGGRMTLKGINVDATGKITFAFKGEGDNLIIRSDFGSINNYSAQKIIEEAIFLQAPSGQLPNIDPNNLPIWGLEFLTPDSIRSVISMVVDVIPLLGSAKAGSDLIFGVDAITKHPVCRLDVACGIVLGCIPGAKSVTKLLGEFVAIAPGAASKSIRYIKKGMKKADTVAGEHAKGAVSKASVGKVCPKDIGWPVEGLVKSHSVWDLDPIVRGIEIENMLAKTDYKDWFRVGQLDNGKFPLVDFQKENVFVSLKTVDTSSKGWFYRMKEHIKQFGNAEATVSGNQAVKRLDIRVQPGGLDMKKVSNLKKIGEREGVEIIILEFKE